MFSRQDSRDNPRVTPFFFREETPTAVSVFFIYADVYHVVFVIFKYNPICVDIIRLFIGIMPRYWAWV